MLNRLAMLASAVVGLVMLGLTMLVPVSASAAPAGWCRCAPASVAAPATGSSIQCIAHADGIEYSPGYGYYRPDGC